MSKLDTLVRSLVVEVIRDEVRRAVSDALRPDELLSTPAAAKFAGVTPATVRRWARDGKLTRHAAGRVIRISRAELERFIKSGRASNDDLTPEQLADKMFG